MLKKRIIYLVVLLLAYFSLLDGAKYAGEFLLINSDVRSMGMGNSGVAYGEGVASFQHNPANIVNVKRISISTMFSSMYGNINDPLAYHHYIGIVVPLHTEKAAFGINWVRFAVDDIPYYPDYHEVGMQEIIENMDGNSSGSFSDREDAVFFTLAKSFDTKLSMGWKYFQFPLTVNSGINIKFININLAGEKASGIGFDAGFGFLVGLNHFSSFKNLEPLKIGISLSDFNKTGISWSNNAEDAIPIRYKLGIEYPFKIERLKSVITVAYDVTYDEYENRKHYGFEYVYGGFLKLRFGYNDDEVTAGTGIVFKNFELDYAYRHAELDMVNKIGLNYSFDLFTKK